MTVLPVRGAALTLHLLHPAKDGKVKLWRAQKKKEDEVVTEAKVYFCGSMRF